MTIIHFAKTIQDKVFSADVEVRMKAIHGQDIIEKIRKKPQPRFDSNGYRNAKMNGIEVTAIIKSKFPQIKIIILTVFDNE